MMRRGMRTMLAGMLALAGSLVPAAPMARADGTITVTTTADDTNGSVTGCSLREAINAANAQGTVGQCAGATGVNTIVLQAGQTYTLSVRDNTQFGFNGLPVISSTIIIQGNGAIIERSSAGGTPSFRLFHVGKSGDILAWTNDVDGLPTTTAAADGQLTLRDVTLKNGLSQGGAGGSGGQVGGGGGAGLGGAMYVRGTLVAERVTFEGNTAQGGTGGNRVSTIFGMGGGGGGLGGVGASSTTTDSGGGGGGFGGAGGFGVATADPGRGGGEGGGITAKGSDGSGFTGGSGGSFEGGNGGVGVGSAGSPGAGVSGNFGGGGGGGGSGNFQSGVGGDGGVGGGGGGAGGCCTAAGAGGFGGGAGGGGGAAGGFGGGGSNGIGGIGGGAGGFGGGGGAGLGGAVFNDGGTVSLTNTTLSGNTARGGAGGTAGSAGASGQGRGGAIFSRNGTTTIVASTIASNSSVSSDGTTGTGAAVEAISDGVTSASPKDNPTTTTAATLAIRRSLLTATTGTGDCAVPAAINAGTAAVVSGVDNLITTNAAGVNGCAGVVSNASVTLPALALYAPGLTQTHLPAALSAVVDEIATANCVETTDQRGVTRPVANSGGLCDIGAVERSAGVIQFGTSAASVGEANGPASLVVRRVNGAEGAISAQASVTGGTATAGQDYTDPGTVTVNFADGNATDQTLSLSITNDSTDEVDETVVLGLTGSNLGTPTSTTLTILDDDPTPSITITSPTRGEGTGLSSTGTATVSLSNARSVSVSVDYATGGGTTTGGADCSTAGVDYVSASGTLTIGALSTSQVLPIMICADSLDEPDETFTITLSNPVNGTLGTPSNGTFTIVDDDAPPSVSMGPAGLAEGTGGTSVIQIPVTVSAPSGQTVTVQYQTGGGGDTAASGASCGTSGVDYQSATGTLTFTPPTTSLTIPVTICGDSVDELDEAFTITLSNPSNATLGTSTAQGTIVDDDTSIVSIADQSLIEGNSGSTPMPFTVSLSVPNSRTVTVQATTVNGTATAGSDYTAVVNQTLTFPAGQTTQTLSVPILGDTADEPNETFTVTLSSPTNATLSSTQASATGTILDDDGQPSLSITGTQVTEPASGSTNATVTVSLLPASGQTVTVQVSTQNGTAQAPGDYTAIANQTVTFNPGETSKPVTIAIQADGITEPTETFTVSLANAANATISPVSGATTVTIVDTSTSGLAIQDASATEGTSPLVFTVTLNPPNSQTVTVQVQTSDSNAKAGHDYTTTTHTLTFQPGDTSKTLSVPILNDSIQEPTETFLVTLSQPTNAAIGRVQATGTITDDDGAPGLSVQDTQVTEGNAGTTNAPVTITLTPASGLAVSVQVSTANGTATAGQDYTAITTQTVTFQPGETSTAVSLPILGDTTDEPDETILVTLSNPSNSTIAKGQATVTIQDDDGASSLSLDDQSVQETDVSSPTMVFTVTLSPASGLPVTVFARTEPQTAKEPDDYAGATQQLTFQPGETVKPFQVTVLGDTLAEGNENFIVRLLNPTNATIARVNGTGSILDDDDTPGAAPAPSPPAEREKKKPRKVNNNTGQHDDEYIEGQIIRIDTRQDPPIVVIQGKDGEIELRLRGDARDRVRDIHVGDYVEADGEKQTEQLYDIDEIEVED